MRKKTTDFDLLGAACDLRPGNDYQKKFCIGAAYLGTAYLAWTIARIILDASHAALVGHRTFTGPLLAAFMMVAWDLSFDPIFSTINHAWVWLEGGSYFGVPFRNFLGWLLTTFVFLQGFALYWKSQHLPSTNELPSSIQSLQAILFYALIAAGYLLNSLTMKTNGSVTDPAGGVWRVQDIYAVTGLIALFTMGAFTILGLVKLMDISSAVERAAVEVVPITPVPYNPEPQENRDLRPSRLT